MVNNPVLYSTLITQAHEVERKIGCLEIKNGYRRVTIVGAGRSLCLDLIPQLVTISELRLSHRIALSLYDEPENFSKLERITKDVDDLNATMIVQDISSGLRDCDILIFLEDITRYNGSKKVDNKLMLILKIR